MSRCTRCNSCNSCNSRNSCNCGCREKENNSVCRSKYGLCGDDSLAGDILNSLRRNNNGCANNNTCSRNNNNAKCNRLRQTANCLRCKIEGLEQEAACFQRKADCARAKAGRLCNMLREVNEELEENCRSCSCN